MVAFVMAYSFTDTNTNKQNGSRNNDPDDDYDVKPPPMMVPMADILNHISDNNAEMFFDTESLKMIAKKAIKKVFIC